MEINHEEGGLQRVVGARGLASTVVNFTIGAGIFALPGIVGIQMGTAGIFGYIFCSIMLTAIVLCYIEIGSLVTRSGGSYAYVEEAFGPVVGFITNWLFVFGWEILGSAALVNVFADSLSQLYPQFTDSMVRGVFFFVLMCLLAWINVRGSRLGVRFLGVVTIVKLIPLFCIIVFGFSHIQTGNLTIQHLPSLQSFGDTALVLFFAFAGFESALNVSGEIKNPVRTIPLGMMLGGLLVLIVYLALQLTTQGILGTQIGMYKEAPLAEVAKRIVGPVGSVILIAAAAISCFGFLCGDLMASPRLLFAGARNGMFPKFLGDVHPRYRTPHWSIMVYAALIFLIAISGGFKQLAILSSAALLLVYLAVIFAMIALRRKNKESQTKSFKVPGGLLIPMVAIISIIWLLAHLSSKEILMMGVFILVICLMYVLMHLLKQHRNMAKSVDDF